MNILTLSEKAQLALGGRLARACHNKGCVVFLQGDLGAGKTTLVRGFLNALGYKGKVKSPTYTLVETYEMQQQTLWHVDLYRIQDPQEVFFLGLFDLSIKDLPEKIIYLIEWPEKAISELPVPDIICSITFFEKGRSCHVTAQTRRGEEIVKLMDA